MKLDPSKVRGKISLLVCKLSTEGLNVSTMPVDAITIYFRNLTNI